MIVAIHQPHYFPWLGYLAKMASVDKFILMDTVQLEKRSPMLRNRIIDPDGQIRYLNVSCEKQKHYEREYRDLKIKDFETWTNRQKGTLIRAYKKCNYFDEVFDAIASVFEKEQPIYIEVGMGKGQFMIGMAKQNPHLNFIGIEKFDSVMVRALEKVLEAGELPNLKLLKIDAEDLTDIFAENEVEGVYLNFSDPWPKPRHAKRRLTHENFLTRYEQITVPNGYLRFKTDNRLLFEYSLVSVTGYGMKLEDVALDLHQREALDWNIMTEYEEKFSAKGQPIYRLEAQF